MIDPETVLPLSDELVTVLRQGGPLHLFVGDLPPVPGTRVMTLTNVSGREIDIHATDTGDIASGPFEGHRRIHIVVTLQPKLDLSALPPALSLLPESISHESTDDVPGDPTHDETEN